MSSFFCSVSLFGCDQNRKKQLIGVIDSECNILEILADAYDTASDLCKHYYGASPEMAVSVINHSPRSADTKGPSFKQWNCMTRQSLEECTKNRVIDMHYIPTHLHHMLFELLKNAMRAVVEYNSDALPPINVLVCGAQENVTIKVRVSRYMSVNADDLWGQLNHISRSSPLNKCKISYNNTGVQLFSGQCQGCTKKRIYKTTEVS